MPCFAAEFNRHIVSSELEGQRRQLEHRLMTLATDQIFLHFCLCAARKFLALPCLFVRRTPDQVRRCNFPFKIAFLFAHAGFLAL